MIKIAYHQWKNLISAQDVGIKRGWYLKHMNLIKLYVDLLKLADFDEYLLILSKYHQSKLKSLNMTSFYLL